jgi:hypothetical protein
MPHKTPAPDARGPEVVREAMHRGLFVAAGYLRMREAMGFSEDCLPAEEELLRDAFYRGAQYAFMNMMEDFMVALRPMANRTKPTTKDANNLKECFERAAKVKAELNAFQMRWATRYSSAGEA